MTSLKPINQIISESDVLITNALSGVNQYYEPWGNSRTLFRKQ
ncbi:MAG: hypothetical protein PVH88_05245 [Ignavibacteria bacterium]|jgi:hypothetical protein